MISAGDFRNGITVEIDGQVLQIVEFQHVKPGKGAAFVRTKLKNVINGGVVERSFRPTEKFPAAHIDRVDMQYLYADGDQYNFMNTETYDQISLTRDIVGDAMKFVKENDIRAAFTLLSRRCSLSLRSPTPSPASRVTPLPAPINPQLSRPALRSRSRCSSISVTRYRSIPVPVSISREYNR